MRPEPPSSSPKGWARSLARWREGEVDTHGDVIEVELDMLVCLTCGKGFEDCAFEETFEGDTWRGRGQGRGAW